MNATRQLPVPRTTAADPSADRPSGPGASGPGTAGPGTLELNTGDLHGSLTDPVLTSMTLLNEITGRYPQAVSFAAGRPYEGHYEAEALHRYLRAFRSHLTREHGLTESQVTRTLFQYGATKGFIRDLIVRHLDLDERITADPEAILVTTGCQEAMVLVLRALRRDERDVVLAPAPTYVGFLGATRLVDMPVRPVREGPDGIDLDDVVTQARRARAEGLRPRALYVVPDLANPSGASMDLAARRALLRIAEREGLLLLEDNPYAMFNADGRRLPTLKALDEARRVVYFGSFAKTAFPGARIGYVIADQPVTGGAAGGAAGGASGGTLLADELAKLKSMLTLNTSTVAQAVIGGLLVQNGCSMERACAREADLYRRNLRTVLDGLAARFPDAAADPSSSPVSWNAPRGGMFAVVTVPFRADDAALEYSARHFGVLWTPMHHFYAGAGGFRKIRLSFSVLGTEEIETGLDRLAALVADRATPGTRDLRRPTFG